MISDGDVRQLPRRCWGLADGADEAEQRHIGHTLARVHRVLRNRQVSAAQRFHWVDPAAAHLELRPWLRPAVAAAGDALTALGLAG